MFDRQVPSIAPEFHFSPSSTKKLPDEDYIQMRRLLQRALLIPSENRWVADWLFLDKDSAFHGIMCLSPEAFEHSFSASMNHQFYAPSEPESPGSFKTSLDIEKDTSEQNAPLGTRDDGLILVPAAKMDDRTVGYAFMEGSGTVKDGSSSVKAAFFGRFVYDCKKKDCLVVIHRVPMAVDGRPVLVTLLMNLSWDKDGVKDHNFVGCPDRDYNFYDLPNRVLTMCQMRSGLDEGASHNSTIPFLGDIMGDLFGNGTMLSISPEETDFVQTSNSLAFGYSNCPYEEGRTSQNCVGTAEQFETFPGPCVAENESSISLMPWVLSEDGETSDGVGIARHPLTTATSSGTFNMDILADALSGIEQSLQGEFHSKNTDQSFVHPVTGKFHEGFSGRILGKLACASADMAITLKRIALSTYFSTVLKVSVDCGLLRTQPVHGAMQGDDCMNWTGRERARNRPSLASLAPRPIAQSELRDQRTSEQEQTEAEVKQLSLEERQEIRRRRNRLSAAKSNEKRKKRRDTQMKALAALRKREDKLTLRKHALVVENEMLRAHVFLN